MHPSSLWVLGIKPLLRSRIRVQGSGWSHLLSLSHVSGRGFLAHAVSVPVQLCANLAVWFTKCLPPDDPHLQDESFYQPICHQHLVLIDLLVFDLQKVLLVFISLKTSDVGLFFFFLLINHLNSCLIFLYFLTFFLIDSLVLSCKSSFFSRSKSFQKYGICFINIFS